MASPPSAQPPAWRFEARLACLVALVAVLITWGAVLHGEAVAVAYPEGSLRGFLTLRESSNEELASGDLVQVARGGRITTQVVFRFRDGSLHDETAVFSQRGHFRLIRGRLVQRGPAFPRSVDMSIDCTSGQVKVRSTDEHGKEESFDERLELPADLANGLVPTLLRNVKPDALPKSLSLVVATPKPRLVKLAVSFAGRERFRTGSVPRQAMHYVLKVEIGGIEGLLAPLVGKQPQDSHVWILDGAVPAFAGSEQPFFQGGPLWRIELTSPSWQRVSSE